MSDLIVRLEAAKGPDRDLDLAILNHGAKHEWFFLDRHKMTVTNHEYGPGAPGNPVCSLEQFTASVDDALMLVPDERYVESIFQTPAGWSAKIADKIDDRQSFEGIEMPNPALALCTAVIKARDEYDDGDPRTPEFGVGA